MSNFPESDSADLKPRGVTIGVVDSGWRSNIAEHRVRSGQSFIASDETVCSSDVDDENGHGTVCTQLILRTAKVSTVIPIRVFGRRLETSPAQIITAIRWACSLNLDVINLSLSTSDVRSLRPLYEVCAELASLGTIVVASSPNDGSRGYPSIFDNVLSVGVLNDDLQAPDIDSDIVVDAQRSAHAWCDQTPRLMSTSLAAALVTGHVANIISAYGRLPLTEMRVRLREEFWVRGPKMNFK
jgi:subtilisin family serine protease